MSAPMLMVRNDSEDRFATIDPNDLDRWLANGWRLTSPAERAPYESAAAAERDTAARELAADADFIARFTRLHKSGKLPR